MGCSSCQLSFDNLPLPPQTPPSLPKRALSRKMEQHGIAVVFPVPTVPRKGRGLVLCFRYQKKILSCTEQKSPPVWRAFLFRMIKIWGNPKNLFALPGDGCRGTGGDIPVSQHPPEKSALGKDGGPGGKEKPCALAKGFPSPRTSFYKPHSLTRRRQRSALLRV